MLRLTLPSAVSMRISIKVRPTFPVVYSYSNIDTVRKTLPQTLKSDWWEWNGNMETEIGNSDAAGYKLTFDSNSGVITVSQWTKGFEGSYGTRL